MKKLVLVLVLCFISVLLFSQTALSLPRQDDNFSLLGFSVRFDFSDFDGEANEIVYDEDASGELYKLSELTWDIKDIYLAGMIISFDIKDKVNWNLGLWKSINKGDGEMTDYDWMAYIYNNPTWNPDDWTHYSRSTVKLDVLIFDSNLEIKFIQKRTFDMALLLGFKYDHYFWTDKAQEYIYSVDTEDGFRKYKGSFGGVDAVDYDIWRFIPYVGLAPSLEWDKLQLKFWFNYSPIMYVKDKDHHILRELYFHNYFYYAQHLSTGLMVNYELFRGFYLSGSFDLSHSFEWQGDTIVDDEVTGDMYSFPGSAGYQMTTSALTISIGFSY